MHCCEMRLGLCTALIPSSLKLSVPASIGAIICLDLLIVAPPISIPPTAMASAPPSTVPAFASPPSKPVDILSSQTSQLYSNLHPILLSSILAFSFKTLVHDPVNTLLGLAPTVAILQALYCVICLPSTGQTPPPVRKPGEKKKPQKAGQDIWAKIVVCLFALSLTNIRTSHL